MLDKLLHHFDNVTPDQRRKFALVLLLFSLVAWPVSAFTFARDEPQFILGLSWFAITITCADVLCTTDVRKTQEDGE